ncbi:MAG: squalene/phytoene synthase family protein [Anaerolineales bacterium]
MTLSTARLARSITRASSKQSYLTARLLADRDLADDCLRAYAYFRWADDMIDLELSGLAERTAFIERQKNLIDALYRGERPEGLLPEEAMLADLIAHDHSPESGLASFIRNFMGVIAFDSYRQGRLASQAELQTYTTCLATAIMDGLQYFIGNGQSYPQTHDRMLAVKGAHITHMLRDLCEDLPAGLINIPAEYLETHAIDVNELNDNEALPLWVREQVVLARDCFRQGRSYIDSLDVLRCKLAGVWYCARFEFVLQLIEKDGFRLRAEYPERHGLRVWLEMARLGVVVTLEHLAGRLRAFTVRFLSSAALVSRWNMPSYHIK